jgi:hypothetical protein
MRGEGEKKTVVIRFGIKNVYKNPFF